MNRKSHPVAVTAEEDFAGQWVKVPMSLIMSDELEDKALLIWIRLYAYSVRPSREKSLFKTWNQLALAAGVPESTFKRYRDRLFDLGLLSLAEDGLRLMIHSRIEEVQEEDLLEGFDVVLVEDEEEEIREMDMVNQVLGMKRRPRAMTEADRWRLAKDTWNKWKPSSWPEVTAKDTQGMVAVCLHLKRFGLKHDDYELLFRSVLLAVAQDDWWMKSFRGRGSIGSVFGRGQDIDNKKFTSVEMLFELGQKIYEETPPEKLFKWGDDEMIVNHWNTNSDQFKGTAFDRVWQQTFRIDANAYPIATEADIIYAFQYYPLVTEYLTREDLDSHQIEAHKILMSKCLRAKSNLEDVLSTADFSYLETLDEKSSSIWIFSREEEVIEWTMRDINIPLIDETGTPQACRRHVKLG